MLWGVLAAGSLVRLALLRSQSVWYDEATVGLLGLRVLRGDLPIYFFGQPYMGALDGYLAAPLYVLLGPTVLALKLLPVLLSIVWMVLIVRLAERAGGRRAATITAVLLVLPPDFMLTWAHEARTHYPLGMVLGSLALLLAWRAGTAPWPRAAGSFAVLGLVTGLAFWTTFLTVVFAPAQAVLVGRRSGRRLLAAIGVGAPFFLLGSLPHWLYGLPRGSALPPPGPPVTLARLADHLRVVGRVSWPIIAGIPWSLTGRTVGTAVSAGLALVYVATIGRAVARAWGRAPADPLPGGESGRPAGRAVVWALLAVLAANIAAAVGTDFGRRLDDRDQKYLLPLYAALPPLVGVGLAGLAPAPAVATTAGLVLLQTTGVADGTLRALMPPQQTAAAAEARGWQSAVATLEREGPRRLYTTDPTTRILTFLSGERVIFSNFYEEILPAYARAVDGAPEIGWWVGGPSPSFEATLKAVGIAARRRAVPGLGVAYAAFQLAGQALVPLDPARFVVMASENVEQAARVADRDADSLWGTTRPRRGGEWLAVDLGATERVALVRAIPGTYQELPSGLRLEASLDGSTWRTLIELPEYLGPLYWSASHPMGRVRSARIELRIPPTPARWLRLTQLGENALWRWTVRELFVYAAVDGAPPPPAPDGLALGRLLREAGVERVYADHGWSARIALADPGIRVLPANRALDAYGLEGSARGLWPAVQWTPGTGVLLDPIDVPDATRAMTVGGLDFRQRPAGPLTLLTYASPLGDGLGAVPRRALRTTASRRPKAASLAIDGRLDTRWSTGRPQAPGDWFRLDVAGPRRLAGLRLWTENPQDAPRELVVEGSVDGVSWQALDARVRYERRFRWVGIGALPAGDGVEAVDVLFPPARLAAIRLTLRRGDPIFDWSIHDLTAYEAP